MKIIHRYITREFMSPFLLTLGSFAVILLISNVFDEMSLVMDNKAAFGDAFVYFLLKLPFLLLQITPLAVLLATLFCLGGLGKTNEITAMRGCGVSLGFMIRPILLVALAISMISLAFNEFVVPWANRAATAIKRERIERKPEDDRSVRNNVAYIGDRGHIFYIKTYNEQLEIMQGVTLFEFLDDRVKTRLDAESGEYRDGAWQFYNGTLREFVPSGSKEVERTRSFQTLSLELEEKPVDFHQVEERKTDQMSSLELWRHIQSLQKKGFPYNKELVELSLKFAFPFANLIMALLAAEFATRVRRASGLVVGFILSLLVAFLYVGFIQVGRALGGGGVISPIWSVWIANILFAGFGIVRIIRANR